MMTDEEMMTKVRSTLTAVQTDMARDSPDEAAEFMAIMPSIIELADGDRPMTRSILVSIVKNFGDL